MTEITKSDVAKFLDFVAEGRPRPCKLKPNNRARKLQGHKPTPIRANRMGEVLRKMFTLAVEWEWRTDKHAGETLGGGGLRGADGTVNRKTGTGNAIQSHRIPDSVFRIMRHKGGLGAAGSHPAVFPVALVEAVLEAFTAPGNLVFEPFCGSGTQLIAAERTGRRCCAVELDPVYCDVAVRRWEMATGRKASRD